MCEKKYLSAQGSWMPVDHQFSFCGVFKYTEEENFEILEFSLQSSFKSRMFFKTTPNSTSTIATSTATPTSTPRRARLTRRTLVLITATST